MKFKDVERLLRESGFFLIRTKGSHMTWGNPKGKKLVISKNPTKAGGTEFGPPIINSLKKRINLLNT